MQVCTLHSSRQLLGCSSDVQTSDNKIKVDAVDIEKVLAKDKQCQYRMAHGHAEKAM
jgi:hypothetical protein